MDNNKRKGVSQKMCWCHLKSAVAGNYVHPPHYANSNFSPLCIKRKTVYLSNY